MAARNSSNVRAGPRVLRSAEGEGFEGRHDRCPDHHRGGIHRDANSHAQGTDATVDRASQQYSAREG